MGMCHSEVCMGTPPTHPVVAMLLAQLPRLARPELRRLARASRGSLEGKLRVPCRRTGVCDALWCTPSGLTLCRVPPASGALLAIPARHSCQPSAAAVPRYLPCAAHIVDVHAVHSATVHVHLVLDSTQPLRCPVQDPGVARCQSTGSLVWIVG